MSSNLSDPIFHDEDAARAWLEGERWPNGPVCPHCGEAEKVTKLEGKAHRPGLYHCRNCRKQFSVTVGTLFERSHIPLHKWLTAMYLIASSKKGMSAHQLHRMLGITYKSAWFMAHRIREAMRSGELAPMGGLGGIVEIDETFIGNDRDVKPKGEKKGRGYAHKHKVLSLIDREAGKARSMVVDSLKAKELKPILEANIAREARVMTDEAGQYVHLGRSFVEHGVVQHNKGEWARGDVHTNTLEGFFSIFKRGMKGVYQHCAKRHLHRYLAEFDFRYNARVRLGIGDKERTALLVRGIQGKRLMYREPSHIKV